MMSAVVVGSGAKLTAAASGYSEQASVGAWPMRVGLTFGVIAVILVILAALRWGWQRRRARQGQFELIGGQAESGNNNSAGLDAETIASDMSVRAKYIGTARSEDLFERIVAGGGPAQVLLRVSPTTLAIERPGRARLPLTADSIVAVGTGRGLLQKSYHRHGLLMITWRWNDQEVVSGFWIADSEIQQRVLTEIEQLTKLSTGSQGGKQ
jgi:hypothetical protein